MDVHDLAQELHAAVDDVDYEAVVDRLRGDLAAEEKLGALARSRDVEVRGFVPQAARKILGRNGIPLLMRLLKDRDPDIRGMALDELEQLDPALLVPIVPRLRRQLASKDDYEVLSTAWTLVRLGDVTSIGPLEAFRDRHESWTWQAKAATVLLLALTSPKEIVERIRAHDHDHMTWLSYAATLIDVPGALDEVRRCAEQGPDKDCRTSCSSALKLRSRSLGHAEPSDQGGGGATPSS